MTAGPAEPSVDPSIGVDQALEQVVDVVNDHLGVVLLIGAFMVLDKWLTKRQREAIRVRRNAERRESRARARQESRNEAFSAQTSYTSRAKGFWR